MPTAPPTLVATSKLVNQPSGLRGKPSGQKTGKDKTQWDPIPITYVELLSKLIDRGFIVPVHLIPLKPPFLRWYKRNVRCDYHIRIPGHLTKNCNAFKYKVQDLVKLGKLKFEESNGPAEVENLFEAKAEMIRQEEKAPR